MDKKRENGKKGINRERVCGAEMIKKQERAEVGRVDTRFVPELTQLEIEEVNKTRYDKTVRMSVSLVKE